MSQPPRPSPSSDSRGSAATGVTLQEVREGTAARIPLPSPAFDEVDVHPILDAVAAQGMAAVQAFTRRYDGVTLSPEETVWDPSRFSYPEPDPALRQAIDEAMAAIAHFHRAGWPQPVQVNRPGPAGLLLEERYLPLRSVGIYAPRGRFPLLSSLLMTAVPARVAGVAELTVALGAVPPTRLEPEWAYTLARLGVRRVLSAGGAQAVAALAFGLPGHLDPVDLIAGPGNRWVTAAKAEVARRGLVGIDLLAGPSEVVVIGGEEAPVDWAVADILAQAEHAPDASGILVSWDRPWLEAAQRRAVAQWQPGLGPVRLYLVAGPEEALILANRIAPEHLGLMGRRAEALADRVTTAGALFIGSYAAEAYGDYVAGPSHVLPTAGTGRFASGLSTKTFLRRMSVIHGERPLDPAALTAGETLARYEGLTHHARALRLRAGAIAPEKGPGHE